MARIDEIREKLAASLTPAGQPKKGYSLRVTALRRELSNLELAGTARTTAGTESEGLDTAAPAP